MEYNRTEEIRFQRIVDYPFASHYVDIDGLRVHYLDEGNKDSLPVLLLHGVPTWSYLYRHMIPFLANAGFRVIVPDLAGFGKSDKPKDAKWHTLLNHVTSIKRLISELDLRDITLFGQDWGSMIGLRAATEDADRFAGIVISNGGLPTGKEKPPFLFILWKLFARFSPCLPIGRLVSYGSIRNLSKMERKAYRAPFPSAGFKNGIRVLPQRVQVAAKDPDAVLNEKAWQVLSQWKKPFLTVYGDKDPITRGWEKRFQNMIPGAIGQNHRILHAGHFIQEDAGIELAEIIITFIEHYPDLGK